ncbi:MAG: Y-family DNA polymerase [Oceanococcaceae bacterium]
MLWLSLDLPLLPLHALGLEPHEPVAVLSTAQRLYCISPAAVSLGLQIGQLVSTAQALAPQARLHPRQPAAEAEALSHLGSWALSFSSQVSLSPPRALVLEIGRSLRLFGGLDALLARCVEELQTLGHHGQIAVAPSPRAAELLARAGQSTIAYDQSSLETAIRAQALEVLGWPDAVLQRLRALGLHQIGAVLDLPREGFSKRYGKARRLELDQLLGQAPDPRQWHVPPPHFVRSADLYYESDKADILLPGFARLFADLAAYLHGRDSGLNRIQLQLEHPRAASTQLTLGLRQPSRDPAHWLRLLAEQLPRQQLPEPVRRIRVEVQDFCRFAQAQSSLFPSRSRQGRGALLETLSARLGPAQLYAVETVDEHRPEYAWQRCEPQAEPAVSPDTPCQQQAPRPLWLLERAEAISPHNLQLHGSAERIESGWWDGRPCRRDYYRARTNSGSQVWVYREFLDGVEPPRWFLHGYFG